MAQVDASARKRTNPPNVPQSGGVSDCFGHDDYSPEYRPSQKRQRRPGGPTSHLDALSISTNSSFVVPDSTFSNIHTQNDTDLDIFRDGFSMFPPGTPPDFQQYPSVDDQLSPQQDVAVTNDAARTPATCTITNDTVSPGPLSKQSPLDPNDCVNQSPDGGSERLFAGPDDFNLSFGDEWQHPMFGNLGKSTF